MNQTPKHPSTIQPGGLSFQLPQPTSTMKITRQHLTRLTALVAVISMPSVVQAQTIWTGVNNVSVTTNWSDTANWSTASSPAGGDVVFDNTAPVGTAGMINNVVDTAFQLNSLTYSNSSGLFHTTFIPSGVDLTVLGGAVIGGVVANGYTTVATVTGGGGWYQSGNLTVGNNGSSTANQGNTLDLSGLDRFVFTGTTLQLGSGNRSAGVLRLAASSNYVNATTLNANTPSSSSSVSGFLTLGAGTNIFHVGTINIAANRGNCTVAYSNATGGLRVRGFGGTDADRATMTIGLRSASGSGGTTTGNLLLNDHPVDMKLGTLTVGQANNGGASGNNNGTGVIQFDTGTIDATTINMAIASANANFSIANGTITVGTNAAAGQKATLLVGNVSLVNLSAGQSATGNLNIIGGSVVCDDSIVKTTVAGTGNVTVTGGDLTVSNTLGGVGAPLNALNLSDAVLTLPAALSANANVTTLNCGGTTNKINVTDVPVVSAYPAQIPLIKYSGALAGTFNIGLGTLPASVPAYSGYISNNTVNSSIDLVITGGPMPARAISWSGATDSNWDTTTANWRFSGSPTTYNQDDFVRFDDAATGTTTVSLTGAMQPSSVTVSNQSKTYGFAGFGNLTGVAGIIKDGTGTLYVTNSGVNDYTGGLNILAGTVRVGDGLFSGNLGAGSIVNGGALVFNRADAVTVAEVISGAGTLTKQGAGILTLSAANIFTGPVLVQTGTLSTLNNGALGTIDGATTVSSGASLDVNARNLGAEPVIVSGVGDVANGYNGAIINTGAGQNNALRYVTLLGDTTFGGAGRWDIRSSTTSDPQFAALNTGGNPYKLTKVGFNQVSLVGVTVDPALGDIEVQQGVFAMETATTSLGNPASNLTVAASASFQLFNTTNQVNKVISLTSDGFTASIINGSGANTIIGPITLVNDGVFNVNGTSLNIAGTLGGAALSKQGSGNLIISGSATHAGTVAHVGTLTINGTHSGGVTNSSTFTAFGGTGTVNGTVDISGFLLPGSTNAIGTLTLGELVLQSGVLGFELGDTTGIGGVANDLIVVNGNLTVNGNQININPVGLLQIGVPYRLINYTGTLTENSPFFVPSVGSYNFTVDTSTPGQVNLVVSGGPPVWNGGSATVNNWTDPANWNGVTIIAGDALYFDGVTRLNNTNDTPAETSYTGFVFNPGAGAFKLNGNSIALAGNIVNKSANAQAINLSLTLAANSTFDGSENGSLIIGGSVTNTANATILTLAGTGILSNQLVNADFVTNTLAVVGTNANWTLRDNAAATPNFIPLALDIQSGSFKFGENGDAPVIRSTAVGAFNTRLGVIPNVPATFNMVNGTLTIGARLNTGAAGDAIAILNQSGGTINIDDVFQGADSAATAVSHLNVSGGIFNVGESEGSPNTLFLCSRGTGTMTVSGTGLARCGTLDMSRNASSASTTGTVNLDGGTLDVQRVSTGTSATGASGTPTATFYFNGGTLKARQSRTDFFVGRASGPAIPIATFVKVGGAIVDSAGFNIGIDEPLQHDSALGATPDGGLTKNGSGALTLTAANSYTGPTVVNAGSLLVNGSIGTAVSVESGGTLGGTGNVGNNVTVKSGGTITAGAANATGNLTVTGNVTMEAGATAFMELNKSTVSSDQVRAIAGTATTITYAGTLSLNNIAGTLAAGDSFKLFSATNYAGSFDSITPATPGDGLQWDTSALNTSGTIAVVALSIPEITSIGVIGGNVVLSGTNGPAGATYVVLTSTDVTVPLASWTPIYTNTFDGSGNFSYTNGVPVDPQRFYTITVP